MFSNFFGGTVPITNKVVNKNVACISFGPYYRELGADLVSAVLSGPGRLRAGRRSRVFRSVTERVSRRSRRRDNF